MAQTKKTAAQLYQEAQAAKDQWTALAQEGPGEYVSSYGAQIDQLLAEMDARPAFAYDPGSDPMYQAYAQQYQRQGRQAMADTLGSAAALTGGYSSSYAVNAASQAYQAYLARMQEAIPSLYAAAYGRYQDEGEALEGELARLQGLESGAYEAWQAQAQQHQAAQSLALDYWRYLQDAAYQAQQDELAQQNWEKEFQMQYAPPARSGGGRSSGRAAREKEAESAQAAAQPVSTASTPKRKPQKSSPLFTKIWK